MATVMQAQRAATTYDELRDRLTGDVVAPGDPDWDAARQAWNLAVDQEPAAVALPESAEDVVEIVRFARRRGLRVAPQGTGHNAAAMGPLAGTILVKTERMRGVSIDPRGAGGPGRRRRHLDRGRQGRGRARARGARRLRAGRRRRRVLARRRRELPRAQVRPLDEQRRRRRDRHRGRPPRPRGRAQPPGPLLGRARRRRQLRRRDGDRDRAVPSHRGLRGRAVLPRGAGLGRAPGLARMDGLGAGRDDVDRADHPVPAAARRA